MVLEEHERSELVEVGVTESPPRRRHLCWVMREAQKPPDEVELGTEELARQ